MPQYPIPTFTSKPGYSFQINFVINKFQWLYNLDGILEMYFAFSSLEHAVMNQRQQNPYRQMMISKIKP